MTYIAPPAVRESAAPDGSVTGTCGELDDEQLQGHIVRAQALVDGYTGQPFYDWNAPELVKDLTTTMAVYYATLAYRKGKELSTTHPVYLAYQDAQKTLKGIQDGTINFEPPSPEAGVPTRRRPKVNNAWRSAADMFPMQEFGMRVEAGDATQGYIVTEDPAISNTGFA